MGLFSKKEKKGVIKEEIPKLPELPRLPEIPETEDYPEERLPQLPSFPNGSLGDKFSQNTIKEAITGREEGEVEAEDLEEAEEEQIPMTRKPLIREEYRREIYPRKEKDKTEPIFIRIDKFEEGAQTLEDAKAQIAELERMFEGIKKIKEKEEKELEIWEEEVRQIKERIEKVDKNIFSEVQ